LPDPKSVSVKKLLGTPYSHILTYPLLNEEESKSRVDELRRVGITTLDFAGTTLLDGIPVLGKGCVGIVACARIDDIPVAVKIRRGDADRATMFDEAQRLRLANSVNVGPRLITATPNLLVMEFFDGIPLYRWAEKLRVRSRASVKRVLYQLLGDCFRLDSIGLDHGELSHAPKNVLINNQGGACIVDFESASTTRRVANITSILQYFLFGQISKRIHATELFPRRRRIVAALSNYKAEQSVESFRALLDLLNLPR
jgi:putative serine/threonine protein kinase